MSKDSSKILIIGLVVVTMLSVGGVVWSFMSRKALYSQINQYVEKNRMLETEGSVIKEKMRLSNEEKNALKDKLEQVTAELAKVDTERAAFKEKTQSLYDENQKVKRELQDLTYQRDALKEKIGQMESTGFISKVIKERAELEVELASLRDQLMSNKSRVSDAEGTTASLKQHLEELIKSKETLEEELAKSEKVKQNLTEDYLAERERRMALEKSTGEYKTESEGYRSKLTRLQDEVAALRRNYEEANRARMALTKELSAMSQVLDERQVELARVRAVVEKLTGAQSISSTYDSSYGDDNVSGGSAVALPPIVVTTDPDTQNTGMSMPVSQDYAMTDSSQVYAQPMTATAMLQGHVLTVNKEHNFVVIDLGENDGINIGSFFDVMRNGDDIGEIEIIEVRKNISAADIVMVSSDVKAFKKDDVVIMK